MGAGEAEEVKEAKEVKGKGEAHAQRASPKLYRPSRVPAGLSLGAGSIEAEPRAEKIVKLTTRT